MLTLLLFILLIIGFSGMALMVWQKMPELKALELPEKQSAPKASRLRAKDRFKEWRPAKSFNTEKALRKIFIKAKIVLLKAERKIDQCLHRVSHSQKFEENYWEKIKKPNKKK